MMNKQSAEGPNRRRVLGLGAAAAATIGTSVSSLAGCGAQPEEQGLKGRIHHSVCLWCFQSSEWAWDAATLAEHAAGLGMESVELVPPDQWPVLRTHGLGCAIAGNGMPDPPFMKGLNNTRYQEQVVETTKATIDLCAEHGVPNVIAFNGYKWNDAEDPTSGEISLEEGAENTVAGLKELAGYGEQKGVTVCLEMLNTRDDTHPMKGHPGYQGDDIDYCADIIRAVGSPRAKLLFDIYHVQIMNGDVIRRIYEMKDIIGHIHTAGNPGRNELHIKQEIHYPSVMEALVEIGYEGFVGHEFIPTRDPLDSLAQAVSLCDV